LIRKSLEVQRQRAEQVASGSSSRPWEDQQPLALDAGRSSRMRFRFHWLANARSRLPDHRAPEVMADLPAIRRAPPRTQLEPLTTGSSTATGGSSRSGERAEP